MFRAQIITFTSFFPQVTNEDLADLPKLQTLDIGFNVIDRIEEGSFSMLPELEEIDLGGNVLTNIPPNLFGGITSRSFRRLSLKGNKVKRLEGFQSLNRLMELDLSGNVLEDLSQSSFSGLDSLRLLNLSNNAILNIQSSTFGSLPSLEILDLSGNRLQTLDGNIFGSSGAHLKQLLLAKNNLGVLQPHLFDPIGNVRVVDVSFNKLTYFDENVFPPLKKINKFFLSHNSIEHFPLKAYELLRTLTEVAIDHNKLTFLLAPTINVRRLRKISLQGNPWQCPCFDEITNFLAQKSVNYMNGLNFDGQKPLCVHTQFAFCIKDLQKVKEERIVPPSE